MRKKNRKKGEGGANGEFTLEYYIYIYTSFILLGKHENFLLVCLQDPLSSFFHNLPISNK